MREIKFRAWHRSAEQMLYEDKLGDVFRWLGEGQPIDIMQYTGLKDKNGKKIWEGDIVNYTSINRKTVGKFVVEWYEYKCGYILSGINGQADLWNRDWEPMRTEIIGNIC